MYLLRQADDGNVSLVQFNGKEVPKYAILSHTWGDVEDEVTFSDVESANGTFIQRTTEDGQTSHIQVAGGKSEDLNHQERLSALQSKKGYEKIRFCGQQASKHNLAYFWIDCCCINRTNSTELSEAITSMFRWYRNAAVCYVYLTDIHAHEKTCSGEPITEQVWEAFRKSRWFTRGWTLQELIAPVIVEFYSQDQVFFGERDKLSALLSDITSLPIEALQGAPPSQFTVEERMSWSDNRLTTLEEDISYCLFGIFDVYMPPLYGEGEENARKRLWNEIRKTEENIKRKLLASLSFRQIDARRSTIRAAHNKTCEWLLSTPAFLAWTKPIRAGTNHGILWIKGKPGAGKSTIMKYVHQATVHEKGLVSKNEQCGSVTTRSSLYDRSIGPQSSPNRFCFAEGLDRTIVVAVFFNARGAELEKSVIGMYRALLVQLMGARSYMDEIRKLLSLSSIKIINGYNWSIQTLQYLLKETVLRVRDPVICFIDALDECEEQQVRDMLYFLAQVGELAMSANISFRVCFASRHYPHISIDKGFELCLEGQEGHNADIAKYVDTELRIGNNETAKEIRQEVQRKSSSIFMWVVIVVGILNKAYDSGRVHELRRVLRNLPSDLNDLFRDMLTRDLRNQLELLLCIDWIISARQPLQPKELYFAILAGAEPDAESYRDPDPDYRNTCKRFIIDSSKGLAYITKSDFPTVQFIHESVRDFLLKWGGLSLVESNLGEKLQHQRTERLMCCCLRYMSVGMVAVFDERPNDCLEPSDGQEQFKISRVECYPFLKCAIQHVWNNGSTGKDVLAKTCRKLHDDTEVTTIEFGTVPSIQHGLLDQHIDVSCVMVRFKTFNETAVYLIYITSGTQEFVRIVLEGDWDLETGGVDIGMYRISVESTDVGDVSCGFRWLPVSEVLCLMAELGNEKVFGALLRTGFFDIDKESYEGRTPMSEAVRCEHSAIVQLLQQAGVDINKSSNHMIDIFHQACMNNDEEKVRVLLSDGLDVNIQGGYYGNALQAAVATSCEPIVKLLLQTGADVNMRGGVYGSALHAASVIGNRDMTKILLDHGAKNPAR